MGQPATLQLKVRHYELDPYGHVNHAHYVHYFEAARIEALEALGLSLPEMRRQGYVIFAVELNVKYLAPARARDTLWIQEIREAASRRLLVTAAVTGAFATEDGRPARAPESFREKLSALLVPDGATAQSQ